MKKIWLVPILGLVLMGCKPTVNDGIVPTQPVSTNGYLNNGPLTIYNNGAVKTGGNIFLEPGVPPQQGFTFNDNEGPQNGQESIEWTITDWDTSSFAGFVLCNTQSSTGYGTVQGPDLSKGGYTEATFWAKTTVLSEPVTGGVPIICSAGQPDNGVQGSPTTIVTYPAWTQYQISLNSVDLTNVQNYFSMVIDADTQYYGFSTQPTNQLNLPLQVNIDDILYQ